MEGYIDYLVPFIMCFNAFIAGMFWYNVLDNGGVKPMDCLWLLIFILFGVFIAVGYAWYKLICKLLDPLSIKFFYKFYFTNQWRELNEEQIEAIKEVCRRRWQGRSLKHRINRLQVRMAVNRYNKEQNK